MVNFWLAALVTCSAFVLGFLLGAKYMACFVIRRAASKSRQEAPNA